jgi:hypothetical protein
MREWIAIPCVLALTAALALVVAGRLKSEPKTAPHPSDSAIASVIRTFNQDADMYWRRIGGDVATEYVNLGDYHDYVKGNAGPVEKPLLATMEVRAQDTDGFLFTADISPGNHGARRATPFAKSRNAHVCLDFTSSGEVLERKRGLAIYDC